LSHEAKEESTDAPIKIGSVFFAAFLKKALRVIISFFIIWIILN
jgi:hypothetical protein